MYSDPSIVQKPPSSRNARLTAAAPVNVRPPGSMARSSGGSSSATNRMRDAESWRWTQRARRLQNSHAPSYTSTSRPSSTARNYTLK